MLMKLVREIPSGIEAEKRWGRISETGEGNTQIGVAVNDLNYDAPKFVTRAKASYMLGIAQEAPETKKRCPSPTKNCGGSVNWRPSLFFRRCRRRD